MKWHFRTKGFLFKCFRVWRKLTTLLSQIAIETVLFCRPFSCTLSSNALSVLPSFLWTFLFCRICWEGGRNKFTCKKTFFYGFLSHIPWRNEPTKKKISLFLNASEVFDADFVVPLSLLSNSFMVQWRNAFCEEEKKSIIFAHLLCFAVELVECPHATLITVK